MKARFFAPYFAIIMSIALFAKCIMSPVSNNGTGSTTETAMVSGILYQSDGITPAAGVRVAIRLRNALADTSGFGLPKQLADTATVMSDDSGRFAFDSSLDTGTYVIEAASGNDAVLIDSVTIQDPDSTIDLPPDTLKPAGALKGIIKLSEGGDPRKVFILAFGIDRFARVNADGSFKFNILAEGRYDLRLISSLDNYGVLDAVNISVISADTTDLDTIDLSFTGIPTPKNVAIAYDTLKQIVTLSWNKADPSLVSGYYVYRRNVDSNIVLARINTSPITDTLYRDSTGTQDQTYEYRVSAIDKNATEGTKSTGVSVKVVGILTLIRTIGDSGNGIGQYQGPSDVAISNDGKIFIADYYGNKVLVYDSLGNFIKQDTGFHRPIGIEIKNDNTYFVLEEQTHTVRLIDSVGAEVFAISGGFGNQEIAWDMAISRSKDLYIVDAQNNRIRVYDSTGLYKKDLPFNFQPKSIEFLNPSVMVLGFSNVAGNTAIVDTAGTIIRQFENGPSRRLAVTQNGNIIGGWDHKSVRIVTPEGVVIGTFVYNNRDDNGGIATDGKGNYFISMLDSKKVLMFHGSSI